LAAIILAKLAPLRGGQFNPFFLECVERCLAHCCSETVLHALVTEFADCFIEMRWHRSPPSKLTVIVPFGDAAKNEKESKLPEFPSLKRGGGLARGRGRIERQRLWSAQLDPSRRDLRSTCGGQGSRPARPTYRNTCKLTLAGRSHIRLGIDLTIGLRYG
jgi:hypothetical protein